jgi:hypothetical protein
MRNCRLRWEMLAYVIVPVDTAASIRSPGTPKNRAMSVTPYRLPSIHSMPAFWACMNSNSQSLPCTNRSPFAVVARYRDLIASASSFLIVFAVFFIRAFGHRTATEPGQREVLNGQVLTDRPGGVRDG